MRTGTFLRITPFIHDLRSRSSDTTGERARVIAHVHRAQVIIGSLLIPGYFHAVFVLEKRSDSRYLNGFARVGYYLLVSRDRRYLLCVTVQPETQVRVGGLPIEISTAIGVTEYLFGGSVICRHDDKAGIVGTVEYIESVFLRGCFLTGVRQTHRGCRLVSNMRFAQCRTSVHKRSSNRSSIFGSPLTGRQSDRQH